MRKDHDHPRHPIGFILTLAILGVLAYPMVAEWLAFTKLANAHVPLAAREVLCVSHDPLHRCEIWRAGEPEGRLGADYRITIERGTRELVSVVRHPWVRLERAHVIDANGCADDADDPASLLCPLGDPVVLEHGAMQNAPTAYSGEPMPAADPWNWIGVR